ncbi:hypothetical protein F4083_04360, partial [Candidatus Poribacteria bacterium]|nr:hypothetical protein [Candidatus Poribacteria bacterium]
METETKQSTPLSSEQMAQWENDGYLLLKDVVPMSEINGVRDRFSHVVDGIVQQLKEQNIVEDDGSELPFETKLWKVAGEHANRFGRSWRGQI